jgi:hypothetical protein
LSPIKSSKEKNSEIKNSDISKQLTFDRQLYDNNQILSVVERHTMLDFKRILYLGCSNGSLAREFNLRNNDILCSDNIAVHENKSKLFDKLLFPKTKMNNISKNNFYSLT